MGIIIQQSFRNLLSTYAGIVIGAVNTLLFYPFFFDQQNYGLVAYLLTAANLFWPFMALGSQHSINKFFSFYKTKKEKDQLFSMALFVPLLFGIFISLVGSFFYAKILSYFEGGNEIVQPYVWVIFVITISNAYFEIFFSWSKVFLKSSFGNFMKEVFHRLGTSVLLLAYYFNYLNLPNFIYLFVAVFALRALIMMFRAFRVYTPTLYFSFPSVKWPLIKYSILILIAGTISVALFDLDKFMIEYFLPIEKVAVYGIPFYIATVIGVPQRAMHQITNPITAQYLNENNGEALNNLYKKSSTNLLLVSGLIFILIVCNIHQIYEIIPPAYNTGLSIVLLISLVKLTGNLIGNNNSILFNSNHYKFVLIIGVIIVVLAVILNIYLIPLYGLDGAAFATFISFMLYDSLKVGFVYKTMGIHPFSKQTFQLLFIISLFLLVFYVWEFPFHSFINILLKSTIISLCYIGISYYIKLSLEINHFIKTYWLILKLKLTNK